MNTMIDQFCNRLKDGLGNLETRLQAVQASIRALPGKAEQVLHDDLAAARSKVEGQLARVQQARDRVQSWAVAKVAETREAVGNWKAKRETEKLNARSERAESYAADSLLVAATAIDKAEAAILEAAVARRDADATRTS